jgi:ribonucleoside-diphosphate reductase alpha chain
MAGPTLPFSEELHAQKYRGEGETFREAMNRVASSITDGTDHYNAFRDALLGMRFMPAGRVQSAMGSTKAVTPYNCFVSGTIEDSFVDGGGSIMARATEAATTMRMGGGIGYDFSTLRPRGAMIRKLQSKSSGPVSFMEIFDAVCKCIASSGHRRGAQMGVLRVDHPDIEEFIHAKHNQDRLTGFNVSIGITDEFMQAVEAKTMFQLKWGGQVYREVNAVALWETIMRSTWDWAEPGVLFIDTINRLNNLWYVEKIAATNPCGEQPLPPHGACLLGSFNLVKYVTGFGNHRQFDWDKFGADIFASVRAMDNVVDAATYPLYEQEKEAKSKRRMGLGITGAANAIEALLNRASYGDGDYLDWQDAILTRLRNDTYRSSAMLAQEKGCFPLFDRDQFMKSAFVGTLPDDVQELIYKNGLRNSHLTSIAPTGTISLCADNVSSGIEPVFAHSFDRKVAGFDGFRIETVDDYGARVFNVKGRTANEVTPQQHVNALTNAARFIDSAVSKTCNVPSDVSWADFKKVYLDAWKAGAKGCTTYRMGGKREGILIVKEDDSQPSKEDVVVEQTPFSQDGGQACFLDPVTGRKECG